jgi:hypothetical protein
LVIVLKNAHLIKENILKLKKNLFSAKKFFPITFLGSILRIAAFSYLMVWWATITGETVGIHPEVDKAFIVLFSDKMFGNYFKKLCLNERKLLRGNHARIT